MPSSKNKAARLSQIEALLLSHPEGLTPAEIARRLDVHRSTISRSLPDLDKNIYIDDQDGGKWKVDRQAYLVNIRLNLDEALAVHLAARLLATRMERKNPHAAAALRKLGIALESIAPRISRHMKQSADVMDDPSQKQDPNYLRSLEVLTTAWAEQRKVKIWHRMYNDQIRQFVLSPYFIEPGAIGQSVYAIGWREPPGALRTHKIERIEHIELLEEDGVPVTYTIPPEFDPAELLADAWGIWYTEGEPQEVVLKFSPRVARRLGETRWHRSEQVTELEDGSQLWQAKIAEPKEILPWIRGWGADVEVIQPEWVREGMIREVKKLARLYGATLVESVEPQYYAHTRNDHEEKDWQKLKDHLTATGDLAFVLGQDGGVSELARTAGLLHDIGKYSQAFQDRLQGSKRKADHATAGAREIMHLFPDKPEHDIAELISYCIAGHHSGLPDYGSMGDTGSEGTLLARREKKKLEDYSQYKKEVALDLLKLNPPSLQPAQFQFNERINLHLGFTASFLTRMIFSTLVDADWLETERFMSLENKPRGQHASIEALCKQFNQFLQRFENPQTEINRKRTETLKACLAKAEEKPGFFTLTVPTGGGKTLASMAFALNHAVSQGLKRIIYVIPFTSIIEQNAGVFKGALGPLGEENVLEHHSNFDWEQTKKAEDDETNSAYQKLKLAAENWDIPIVVTTNVQFFESLFASKKSRARKVHNMAKSVVIFDEVQMLPREYLKPCLLAITELVQNYHASAVFCTATQPSLERFFPPKIHFRELAPNPQALFDFYRRIQVQQRGILTDENLCEELMEHQQALCIVNTRRHAKGLYDRLEGEDTFHLSTLMCPAHRKRTLEEIRERLERGDVCRVVSTQVMEAGIDLDFPVGYRAMAGLDSIIQAAGRVNREGKKPTGDIFVFEPKTIHIKKTPAFIQQTASVARSALRDFEQDPTCIAAIESYYSLLYILQDEKSFDVKQIVSCFEKGSGGFDFQTAGENFRLIENATTAVIIPYEKEALQLIERLKYTTYPASVARKLQMYTVNVYDREFQALQSKGVIQCYFETYHVLDENWMESYYHPKTGLVLPASDGGEAIFFD